MHDGDAFDKVLSSDRGGGSKGVGGVSNGALDSDVCGESMRDAGWELFEVVHGRCGRSVCL